jgi:ferredoxin-NADP reductase
MSIPEKRSNVTCYNSFMPGPTFQPYKSRLAWKNQINERFCEFHFELIEPNRLSFQAGQYVFVRVPETGHQRSYSITSPPNMNHAVELLVDLVPQGPGTRYLASLEPGQVVEMMAPLGGFVVPDRNSVIGQAEKSLVFVATGSGIAPFKSMLTDLLITQNDTRPMMLLWGMRYEADQFWYDDFGVLAQEHPNLSFQPVLSKPSEAWPFHKGYVTDVLSVQTNFLERGYFICGRSEMIQDVRTLLIDNNVPLEHIHTESFF